MSIYLYGQGIFLVREIDRELISGELAVDREGGTNSHCPLSKVDIYLAQENGQLDVFMYLED